MGFEYFYSENARKHCIGINISNHCIKENMRAMLNSIWEFDKKGYEILIDNQTETYGMNFNFVICSLDKNDLKCAEQMFIDTYKTKYHKNPF